MRAAVGSVLLLVVCTSLLKCCHVEFSLVAMALPLADCTVHCRLHSAILADTRPR